MKNTLIDKVKDNQKEEINAFDDVIKRISPKLKGKEKDDNTLIGQLTLQF